MKIGSYDFYTIQAIKTHEKKDDINKYVLCKGEQDWFFPPFRYIAEPWHGIGNNYGPQFPESHKELYELVTETGYWGWYSIKFAILGIKRLQEASERGLFTSTDNYGKIISRSKFNFRIIKIHMKKTINVVSIDEILKEISV